MTLPNFIIIGAARSGTTSLYNYLRQHPDVFMSPVKETNFFVSDEEKDRVTRDFRRHLFPVKSLDEYCTLFGGRRDEKAIGEASPFYLATEDTPKRIRRTIPNVKLAAIFRNPVEQVYSAYRLQVLRGFEERSFDEVIRDEKQNGNSARGLPYRRQGFYHRHVTSYLKFFDRSQLKFFLFEDLTSAPDRLVRSLFEFLRVDPEFRPDVSIRYNSSNLPRARVLRGVFQSSRLKTAVKSTLPDWLLKPAYAFVARIQGRSDLQETPSMPRETEHELIAEYKDDILKFQDLIERDLSAWLRVSREER